MALVFRSIHQKYASHGLGTINRKYIYIPYKKKFLPLYYDGNVQFLPGKTDCNKKIDREVLSEFIKDFKFLTNKKLSKMQECVFKDIYYSSKNSLKKYEDFFTNTNDKKLSNYDQIKNKIIYYINNIFNIFGLTNRIPIYLSVFFPIIFLSIISTIGLIRINEK